MSTKHRYRRRKIPRHNYLKIKSFLAYFLPFFFRKPSQKKILPSGCVWSQLRFLEKKKKERRNNDKTDSRTYPQTNRDLKHKSHRDTETILSTKFITRPTNRQTDMRRTWQDRLCICLLYTSPSPRD